MKNKITIAVIVGSGKSGKYLVKELIKQGFQLRILLRNAHHLQINNPFVEFVIGDVIDYSSVRTLL